MMKDVEGREMRPKWEEDSEEQVILLSIILDYNQVPYTNMATEALWSRIEGDQKEKLVLQRIS